MKKFTGNLGKSTEIAGQNYPVTTNNKLVSVDSSLIQYSRSRSSFTENSTQEGKVSSVEKKILLGE